MEPTDTYAQSYFVDYDTRMHNINKKSITYMVYIFFFGVDLFIRFLTLFHKNNQAEINTFSAVQYTLRNQNLPVVTFLL